ncbi:RDD family protein [Actinotalea subterranea]|uniref:RDD family protein n=1 Tax=Actinotalea subterranea TaxID=2607497 RepID=UPI0011EC30FB|nr:RDD family protein [Actinotalea subterranea]
MQDEILIGEGVVLDARPASFATRMLGAAIDVAVVGVLGWILIIVAATFGQALDEAAAAALGITALVVMLVGVPATVETLTRGRSLGKLALGIRIVRDDGGPVRVRHALIRALVGVLELWFTFGSIALISSLVHPQGKRLGDLLAGTYAVRVRGGQKALPPLVMPMELAGWARTADIRRLPDGLALSARQFLGRAGRLHMASRVRLGVQLAGEIERYVAPGPPPGTHPERFIAAVLAERRDREFVHAAEAARRASTEALLLHRLPHAVPDPIH